MKSRRRRVEPVETSEFDAGGDIVLCMSQLNLSARAYAQQNVIAREA